MIPMRGAKRDQQMTAAEIQSKAYEDFEAWMRHNDIDCGDIYELAREYETDCAGGWWPPKETDQ